MSSKVIPFHEFCRTVIGLKLSPGQSVVAKCIFGGMQPAELLNEKERDMARTMFGNVDVIPDSARRIVVLRLGRGSGKTTLSAAFSIYNILTCDVSECGPGDTPTAMVIAPDKPTAQLTIRMAREMMRLNKSLEALVEGSEDTKISIRRPDGKLVAIEAFAASRGGASVRGRSITSFILDEAEFFRSDESNAVNDRAVYGALIPRLMSKGKGIFLSTPWPVETLMGQLFEQNYGRPLTATAAIATTIQMRPEKRALVEAEFLRDRDNAEREFNCQVEYLTDGGFFDAAALSGSLDAVSSYPFPRNPLWPCAVGVDFAFKQDSSTLVVVQFDGKYYRVCRMVELRPKKGQPLKPSEVVKEFAEIAKIYGVSAVISDGHYREAIREHLNHYGLSIFDAPEGAKGKHDVYSRTKGVLHEGLCRIPDNKEGKRLLDQAKTVVAKPAAGGTLSIRTPRRNGMAHGDLVSAWTLAVHFLAYGEAVQAKPKAPPKDSPEWHTDQEAKRLRFLEEQERKYLKEAERAARKSRRT